MRLALTFVFTAFLSIVLPSIATRPPIPTLSEEATRTIQTRQHRPKRDILDICIYLDLKSLLSLGILGLPLDVFAGLNICLCLSALPLALETNIELKLLTDLLGGKANLIAYLTDFGRHCHYPPHSHPVCTKYHPCGYECDHGYTPQGNQCICEAPRVICNGVCGPFPNGCPSAVPCPPGKRTRDVATSPSSHRVPTFNGRMRAKKSKRSVMTRRVGLLDSLGLGHLSDSVTTSSGTTLGLSSGSDLSNISNSISRSVVSLYVAYKDLGLSSSQESTDIYSYVDAIIRAYVVLYSSSSSASLDDIRVNADACTKSINSLQGYCAGNLRWNGLIQATNDLLKLTESFLSYCNAHAPTESPHSTPATTLSNASSEWIYLDLHNLLSALALGGIDIKSYIDLGPAVNSLVNGLLSDLGLGGVPSAYPIMPQSLSPVPTPQTSAGLPTVHSSHPSASHAVSPHPPNPTFNSDVVALIESVTTLRLDATLLGSYTSDRSSTDLVSSLVDNINTLIRLTLALCDLSSYDALIENLGVILQSSTNVEQSIHSCDGYLSGLGLRDTVARLYSDTDAILKASERALNSFNDCGCRNDVGLMNGLVAVVQSSLTLNADGLSEITL